MAVKEEGKHMLKVARHSLRQELAHRLFRAIVSGELHPGERLGEVRLAKQLGVGQSTLREALQELVSRGLLTKADNRGTFVARLTVKTVEDIYAVRLPLEPLAAALASEHMTEERTRLLYETLEKMREALRTNDLPDAVNDDLMFHQAVWRFSGNEPLQRALSVVCAPLFGFYLVHASMVMKLDDLLADADEHVPLVEALESGNPEQARAVFLKTLEDFRTRHIQHVLALESPG